ncbi:MAG: matrixin family metalloprotease [Dehalococcoidia bacterium]
MRGRRAALGLMTLAGVLWGGTALVLAGGSGDARADTTITFRDEDILLQVTGDDGEQYYAAISMLIGDDGQDYAANAQEARDAMIARFPGAVVVGEDAADEVMGGLEKQVHQYVTNNYWWADHGTSWSYNAAGGPGVPGEQGAVSAGSEAWALSGAQFGYSGGGSSTAAASGCSDTLDDENVVAWAPLQGATLGVACTWFQSQGSPRPLIEFDMELDPGWDWTTSSSGVGTDLQSVATHEFGHALGLGHSSVQQAVMYFSYTSGSLKRTLHADDIAGAISIYGGTAPEPTATSTNTPSGPTATPTNTKTPTPTKTPTATKTPSARPTAGGPTNTPTATKTPTPTKTGTVVGTPTKTATPTKTPSVTTTPAGGPPTLALKPGANLLTWPGQTMGPSQALAGQTAIEIVYQWDPVAKKWNRYAPDVPPWVSNLTTLDQGKAYWFLTSSAGLIAYTE